MLQNLEGLVVLVNADLHIHSRFAGATSAMMTVDNIARLAPKKGISMVGCGDCLHPVWLKEVTSCEEVAEGTYQKEKTRFLLSCEVEAEKRVHHLLFFPCKSKVEEFKELIKPSSSDFSSDGRPKVKVSGERLAEFARDVGALIGPAHAFTPWTAMYGAFDSLKECYGDMNGYVSFLELGLSADTSYADRIQEITHLTFLSNSDAHSPHPVRLGREFNRFEVSENEARCIFDAIFRKGAQRCVLNVGLPPEEGKYNESACISCYTHYSLQDAVNRHWRCSCGKRIKKGVKDRTTELSTFESPHHPEYRPKYFHIIPLAEIIAKALGVASAFSKTVEKRWEELVDALGSEIHVLVDASFEEIQKATVPAIAEAIFSFRSGQISIHPGGGGEYGQLELPVVQQRSSFQVKRSRNVQSSMFEFGMEEVP